MLNHASLNESLQLAESDMAKILFNQSKNTTRVRNARGVGGFNPLGRISDIPCSNERRPHGGQKEHPPPTSLLGCTASSLRYAVVGSWCTRSTK